MSIEALIYSFGLTVSTHGVIQLFDLIEGDHPFVKIFTLMYEITIIFLIFQLGALRYMKETGESLEKYFEEEGGYLVIFSIFMLILCSLGTFFADWSNYKLKIY